MTSLKHDAQGFLVGTPIDLSSATRVLNNIWTDVRAIRQALAGGSTSRTGHSSVRPQQPNDSAQQSRGRSSSAPVTPGGERRLSGTATPSSRAIAEQKAIASVTRKAVKAALPKRGSNGQFVKGGGKAPANNPSGDEKAINSLAGRLSRAVLNAGNGMEEADPAVKAFQEVAQPLARGYELFSGGEDKKQTGLLRRVLSKLTVFHKDETALEKANAKTLKAIEAKPEGVGGGGSGGGLLSSLLGMIPGVGLGKGLLSKLPGCGGLFGGAGKAGGLLGGAKALGKGFLKRIPILGALLGGAFAWNEASAADNDDSLSPDQKNGAKGKAWGGAAGGVVGAAVGSLLGPLGTIAGAVIGDWLGGQFGELIGGKWTAMTESIGSAWETCTSVFSATWDGGIKKWEGFVESAKSSWDTVAGLFKSAYEGVKKTPVIGPVVNATEDVAKKAAELASNAGTAIKDAAVSAAETAKNKAVAAGSAVKDAAINGADYVAKKTLVGRAATGAYQGAKDFGSNLLNRSFATGAEYKAGNIGGLDEANTRGLVASTAMTESGGGKLDAINKQGYMGRYQAGAGWLADAGMINGGGAAVQAAMKRDGFSNEWKWSESGGMTRFLDDSANWKEGLSKEKYLASADLQDSAFKTNSDSAYASLVKSGKIVPGVTSQAEVAGLLKARHLSGLGGAKAVANGGEGPKDANGTSARKYFNDVALDKHGLTAAFSPPVMPTITASASAPSVPASPPVPSISEAPAIIDPMASTGARPAAETSGKDDVGQDIRDRRMAHIVTGGMSA